MVILDRRAGYRPFRHCFRGKLIVCARQQSLRVLSWYRPRYTKRTAKETRLMKFLSSEKTAISRYETSYYIAEYLGSVNILVIPVKTSERPESIFSKFIPSNALP